MFPPDQRAATGQCLGPSSLQCVHQWPGPTRRMQEVYLHRWPSHSNTTAYLPSNRVNLGTGPLRHVSVKKKNTLEHHLHLNRGKTKTCSFHLRKRKAELPLEHHFNITGVTRRLQGETWRFGKHLHMPCVTWWSLQKPRSSQTYVDRENEALQ